MIPADTEETWRALVGAMFEAIAVGRSGGRAELPALWTAFDDEKVYVAAASVAGFLVEEYYEQLRREHGFDWRRDPRLESIIGKFLQPRIPRRCRVRNRRFVGILGQLVSGWRTATFPFSEQDVRFDLLVSVGAVFVDDALKDGRTSVERLVGEFWHARGRGRGRKEP